MREFKKRRIGFKEECEEYELCKYGIQSFWKTTTSLAFTCHNVSIHVKDFELVRTLLMNIPFPLAPF